MYKVLYDTEARRHKETKMEASVIIDEQTAEIERLLLEVERMEGEVALYRRLKIKESPELRKSKRVERPKDKRQKSEGRRSEEKIEVKVREKGPWYFKEKSEAQARREAEETYLLKDKVLVEGLDFSGFMTHI